MWEAPLLHTQNLEKIHFSQAHIQQSALAVTESILIHWPVLTTGLGQHEVPLGPVTVMPLYLLAYIRAIQLNRAPRSYTEFSLRVT